jgi:hypothetical protein
MQQSSTTRSVIQRACTCYLLLRSRDVNLRCILRKDHDRVLRQ